MHSSVGQNRREQACGSLSSVRCPLCKTENLSTIHAFDGESYERWYINQEPRKRRLSDAQELVSQFYNMEEIAGDVSSVQQYWKQQKYLRKNIWLETWLRREIQALTWDEDAEAIVYHIHGVLESFMKRHKRDHTSRNITAEERREEFKNLLSDAARPFLLGRTERFVRGRAFPGLKSEHGSVQQIAHSKISRVQFPFNKRPRRTTS